MNRKYKNYAKFLKSLNIKPIITRNDLPSLVEGDRIFDVEEGIIQCKGILNGKYIFAVKDGLIQASSNSIYPQKYGIVHINTQAEDLRKYDGNGGLQ